MIKRVSGSRPLSIICIVVSYRFDVFKKKTWGFGFLYFSFVKLQEEYLEDAMDIDHRFPNAKD